MKKRGVALALAGVLALSPLFSATPLAANAYGDLNGDGFLTSADMRLLLIAQTDSADKDAVAAADLNESGTVNAADEALLWQQMLAFYRGDATPTETATETATATATAADEQTPSVKPAPKATAKLGSPRIKSVTAPSEEEETTTLAKKAENTTKQNTDKTTVKSGKKTEKTAKKTTVTTKKGAKTTEKTTKVTTKKTTKAEKKTTKATTKKTTKATAKPTTKKTTKATTKATTKKTAKTTKKPASNINASPQSIPTKTAALSPQYTPSLKTSSVKESTFMKKIQVVNSATGKVYKGDTKANLQLAVTADVKYELGSSCYAQNSTEAWKAHAVASYTRICDVCADGSTFTISMGEDVNLNNANDKRIYDAVGSVLGIKLMTGSGYSQTCNVFYSASAAGTTSSCNKVFTQDLPYARSVFSPETDALVEKYGGLYTDTYTASFKSILADVESYMEETIYYDKKDGYYPLYATEWDGAYVARSNLYYKSGGEKVYIKGTQIRSALGLRSASFAVTSEKDGKLTLTIHGHGHGLGLSQLGAVIYANDYGWRYDQILAHYFSITENSAHQLCLPNW